METEEKENFSGMFVLSGFIIALMLGMSAAVWLQLPTGAEIPVHWNAAGQVDRYGGKFEGLLLLPLITLGITLLLGFVPRLDSTGNISRSSQAYQITWGVLLFFFLLLHGGIMATVLGYAFNLTALMMGATGFMFIIIGNAMRHIRQNNFFGIRTPWTLKSELSWDKTHQLGSKLFMAVGLLTMLSAFISSLVATIVMVMALFLVIIVVMVYSYQIWKADA